MGSDGEEYYDSEEGYVGPSDDEDPWAEEDDAPSTGPPSSTADLATFRSGWQAEVSHNLERRARVSTYEPGSPGAKVLLDPDLADLILSSPSLTSADRRSIALVCTNLAEAAQRALFREVRLQTPSKLDKLQEVLERKTDLAKALKHVELSLADVSELLMELPMVRAKMEEKRRLEVEEPVEYYRAADGSTVEVQPWEKQLERRVGRRAAPEKKAAVRRLLHLDWAMRQLEAEDPQLASACDAVSAGSARWPFRSAYEDQSTETRSPYMAIVREVVASAADLTLSFPLSHFFPSLMFALSDASRVSTLAILGSPTSSSSVQRYEENDPPNQRRAEAGDEGGGGTAPAFTLSAPPAYVPLAKDGRGIKGGWSGVKRLTLRALRLVLPEEDAMPTTDAQSSADATPPPSWELQVLEMEKVRGCGAPAGGLQPNLEVRFSLTTAEHPSSDAAPATPLDLCAFLSLPSPVGLTALSLIDVDHVSLSSVFAAIQLCGPSLTHLTLQNLNLGRSLATDPADNAGNEETARFLFSLSRLRVRSSEAEARCFSGLETAARRLLRPSTPPLAPTAADALRCCTSLSRLRLLASSSDCATSPFPPAILDALLAADPPLRELRWDVGVEGPARADGLLGKEDWSRFADKLEAFAAREEFVDLKSEVQAAITV
ncbi:hypothetical protein JCM10213_008564 [Rhodosporidiobolus nylandii]